MTLYSQCRTIYVLNPLSEDDSDEKQACRQVKNKPEVIGNYERKTKPGHVKPELHSGHRMISKFFHTLLNLLSNIIHDSVIATRQSDLHVPSDTPVSWKLCGPIFFYC